MGKTKHAKPSQMGRNIPLEQDIEDSKFAKSKNRNKIRLRQDEEEQFVGSNLSRKILSAARQQQLELEDGPSPVKSSKVVTLDDGDKSESNSDAEEDTLEPDTYYENIEINEDDEKAMEMFMSRNPLPRRTLADIIMEKITEKQTELDTYFSDAGSMQMQDLDPRIKTMYEGVRDVLRKYRSGKLPKAFKIIPSLKNWEQILYITDPPSWSAAAMYQATRIFASNLKENMAQRFYNLVLLPRIRDDLAEYKRLNFHLYQALRKSLFKPGGFMKGILLPLLESGNCTLREAIIVGSVVARNSIPILHSSAAMLKIAEMDYTGANSIFLRIFLDKKYALPYRVVDALVFHFLSSNEWGKEIQVNCALFMWWWKHYMGVIRPAVVNRFSKELYQNLFKRKIVLLETELDYFAGWSRGYLIYDPQIARQCYNNLVRYILGQMAMELYNLSMFIITIDNTIPNLFTVPILDPSVFGEIINSLEGQNRLSTFEREHRELPVLWHQAFLTFVQRYKADISSEQRDTLLELLKKQNHHTITSEVRRELQNAKCRDAEDAEPKMDFD